MLKKKFTIYFVILGYFLIGCIYSTSSIFYLSSIPHDYDMPFVLIFIYNLVAWPSMLFFDITGLGFMLRDILTLIGFGIFITSYLVIMVYMKNNQNHI